MDIQTIINDDFQFNNIEINYPISYFYIDCRRGEKQ